MATLSLFLLFTKLVLFLPRFSSATDTLNQFQSLSNGKTLVSKDGSFELGFFSPAATSTNLYLGIWYKNIPVRTIVWVANGENPSRDNSSKLSINREGNLVLLSKNETVVWSSNSTTNASSSIVVQLLDSGNLVLKDERDKNTESFLWQSFDYPSDTFLPGMKIGWDLKRNLSWRLTAWKNWDDPSPGDFVWGFKLGNSAESVMWKGSEEFYRSGPWNGDRFSGSPTLKPNQLFEYEFVSNEDEVYYSYKLKNKSVITRVVINQTLSKRIRFTWIAENKTWRPYQTIPRDDCDDYNVCGPFGHCIEGESPKCKCLSGFKPKSPQEWDSMDWAQGCVRSELWRCNLKDRDGFNRFSGLKLPDTTHSWVNANLTLEECEAKCLSSCSCMAYANLYVTRGGSGCAIWFGDLIDMRLVSTPGQDLYIRMAVTDTAVQGGAKSGKKKKVALVVTFSVLSVFVVLLALSYIYGRKRKSKGQRGIELIKLNPEKTEKASSAEKNDKGGQEDLELPLFDLATIATATSDFSDDKKLGEGGFGPVYRGTLDDGQEIAVKRLSRTSGQGLKELKNEVILCSKLQHRNLVKLLGCCIQGDENMLVYEYMPNRSLDSFLFDSARSKLLDWSQRFYILCGIARGLLYLHQDSRLRIIHRDLKASNVLLDNKLNPKISDFGLARMFGGDQIEGNTSRVAGTYGYMAPEYAIDGLFSIKSDVFSYGILLLEIVSGMKNRGVYHPNHKCNLIGHVWRFWKEGKAMELIDACLGNSFNASQVMRCIHIGLLCVQQHPEDRPNMASVVVMLSSESTLPQPKEPGFLIIEKASSVEGDSSSAKHVSSSINEITVSLLEAR